MRSLPKTHDDAPTTESKVEGSAEQVATKSTALKNLFSALADSEKGSGSEDESTEKESKENDVKEAEKTNTVS